MLAFAVLCDVAYCSSLSKPHFEACTQLCSVGSVVRLLLVSQIVMYITDVLFAWVDFSDSVRCFLVLWLVSDMGVLGVLNCSCSAGLVLQPLYVWLWLGCSCGLFLKNNECDGCGWDTVTWPRLEIHKTCLLCLSLPGYCRNNAVQNGLSLWI